MLCLLSFEDEKEHFESTFILFGIVVFEWHFLICNQQHSRCLGVQRQHAIYENNNLNKNSQIGARIDSNCCSELVVNFGINIVCCSTCIVWPAFSVIGVKFRLWFFSEKCGKQSLSAGEKNLICSMVLIEVNLWFAALAPGTGCDITTGLTVTHSSPRFTYLQTLYLCLLLGHHIRHTGCLLVCFSCAAQNVRQILPLGLQMIILFCLQLFQKCRRLS